VQAFGNVEKDFSRVKKLCEAKEKGRSKLRPHRKNIHK
jgi:hypothetical protein